MLAWVMLVGALSAIGPTGHLLEVPYRNQLDGSAYAWANCGPTSTRYGPNAERWVLSAGS
jgi:predicted NAD/FAD-dependent oxidoreductase